MRHHQALTFYIARHTLATTTTLTNGVPIKTVSSMLGHKNLRTTQIYTKVVEHKVGEDTDRLEERPGKAAGAVVFGNHPGLFDSLPENR